MRHKQSNCGRQAITNDEIHETSEYSNVKDTSYSTISSQVYYQYPQRLNITNRTASNDLKCNIKRQRQHKGGHLLKHPNIACNCSTS
jgi:hypothetical protein